MDIGSPLPWGLKECRGIASYSIALENSVHKWTTNAISTIAGDYWGAGSADAFLIVIHKCKRGIA